MFVLYPQDYIEDNDSLALLHDQIHECDNILSQIGSVLGGFQVHGHTLLCGHTKHGCVCNCNSPVVLVFFKDCVAKM